jgi:hypothetical protein
MMSSDWHFRHFFELFIDAFSAAFAHRPVCLGDTPSCFYDEALRLDPNNALAFNNRAAALLQRRDYLPAVRSRDHAPRSRKVARLRVLTCA